MSKVKSSLEIALERTANIDGDQSAVDHHTYRQTGKRIVAHVLADRNYNIEDEIRDLHADALDAVRIGMRQAILPLITLPTSDLDLERYGAVAIVLNYLASKKRRGDAIAQQLEEIGYAYIHEKQSLIVSLRQNFESVARQKAAQVAQQTGMEVAFDPASLPEFQQELHRHLSQHTAHYQRKIDAVRSETIELLEQE